MIKTYMIVTNDDYELPVMTDIKGIEKISEEMQMSVQAIRHRLMRDSWKGKYKVVVDTSVRYRRKTKNRNAYFVEYRRRKKMESNNEKQELDRRRIQNP